MTGPNTMCTTGTNSITTKRGLCGLVTAAALTAASGLAVSPAAAQDRGMDRWYDPEIYQELNDHGDIDLEYEPGEGLHEEEWYDPTDWFDDDTGIDYEVDGDRERAGGASWYLYDPVTGDVVAAADSAGYGTYFVWEPSTRTWERRYGLHNSTYQYRGHPVRPSAWYIDDRRGGDVRTPQQQANRSRQQQKLARDHALFRGVVDGFKAVELEGQRDRHSLVRLRLEDGRTRIVNLGPGTDVSELDLESGDRVTVLGRRGSIDNRPVLMATRLRIDGEAQGLHRGTGHRADRTKGEQSRSDRATTKNRERAGERADQRSDVQRIKPHLSDWSEPSRAAALAVVERYGYPDETRENLLAWDGDGQPWSRMVVYRTNAEPSAPKRSR